MHYKKYLYNTARFLRLISKKKYNRKMQKYGDYSIVKNSDIFDGAYYLVLYPEVAKAGLDPVSHYLEHGWKDNLSTSRHFDREKYLREVLKGKKENPVLHFEKNKRKNKSVLFFHKKYLPSAAQITDNFILSKYPSTRKLNLLFTKASPKRINLVLDCLGKNSFFGGVGTACLLASAYALENGCALRIITRDSLPQAKNYYDFMKLMGRQVSEKVDFFSDFDAHSVFRLEICEDDVFMATSWWSARSLLNSGIKNFFYLIQEVETFFYEFGDVHLACASILENENIKFIVNSSNLYNYFKKNNPTVTNNGVFFEPAFSKKIYYPCAKEGGSKYNLFFYARAQGNSRNLYYTGLSILEKAISSGVLDTQFWDIYFAGSDGIKPLEFSNGYSPKIKGIMPWSEYAQFLSTVDLGLAFIYTPHSGYPALDVLASGAVSVTNDFPGFAKTKYSDNMILCPLNEPSLLKGLEQGLRLAEDESKRKLNYENSKLPLNWDESFKETLAFMRENK